MAKADNTGGVYPLTAASRIQDYTLIDITPTQVNQILREVRNGRLEYVGRLYRLMHDTWPRFRQNINKACRAVSRLELEVKPGLIEGQEEPTPRAQEIYETVERALESCAPRPGYWELGQTEMLDALMECEAKGPVAVEIIWQIENNIWSPRCYIPVPDRALSYPTDSNQEERLMFAKKGAAFDNLQDFPADKFLVGVRSQGGIHPIFSGAMRPLVKYWMAAVFGMGWYLQYVQLYGIPWRTVKTDGSEGAMTAAESLLADVGAQGWAATGPGVELTIHDAVGGSAENLPQAAIIELANRTCDLIFLGQTLTTDNTGTGSRALGEVHADTLSDMEQERAKWLADTLNAQLIPAIVRKNYGPLPAEEMPYCEIVVPEVEDEKATAERVKILAEIGVPMTKKWVYEALKVPEPKEGEALFNEPMPAVMPPLTPQELDTEDDEEDAIPTEEMALAAQSAIDTLRSIPLYKRPLYIGAVETVRARDISNRVELDKDQIDRMDEFFAKHEDERISASFDPESRFGLQWASWGGDAGNEWIKARKA